MGSSRRKHETETWDGAGPTHYVDFLGIRQPDRRVGEKERRKGERRGGLVAVEDTETWVAHNGNRRDPYRDRRADPPAAEPTKFPIKSQETLVVLGEGWICTECRSFVGAESDLEEGQPFPHALTCSRRSSNAAYDRVLEKTAEMRLALHGGTPAWSFDAEEELDERERAVEALQKEK